MEDRTFSINLYCGNCGNDWEERVPYKTEVSNGWDGVWFHPSYCGYSDYPCKGWRAECAVCGLSKHVKRRYANKGEA